MHMTPNPNPRPLCESVTSSTIFCTQQEVYNTSQRHKGAQNHGQSQQCVQRITEVPRCGFWDMQAQRQRDRQTNILITILYNPPGGKAQMSKDRELGDGIIADFETYVGIHSFSSS